MTINNIIDEIKLCFTNNEYNKSIDCLIKYEETLKADHLGATSVYDLFVKYEYKEGINKVISLGNVDFKKQFILDHLLKSSILEKKMNILQFLIDVHKVDVFSYGERHSTARDDKKNYLIAYASAVGTPEILDCLVEKGMDINSNNKICFKFAASNDNVDNLNYMVEKYKFSIDEFSIPNLDMYNALSWAIESEALNAIDFLLEKGIRVYPSVFEKVLYKKEETLTLFSRKMNDDDLQKLISINETEMVDELKERNKKILNYVLLNRNLKVLLNKNDAPTKKMKV